MQINVHSNVVSFSRLKFPSFDSTSTSIARPFDLFSSLELSIRSSIASWVRLLWWRWLWWFLSLDLLLPRPILRLRPILPLRCRLSFWDDCRNALFRVTTSGFALVGVSDPSNGFTAFGSTLFKTDLVCLTTIIMLFQTCWKLWGKWQIHSYIYVLPYLTLQFQTLNGLNITIISHAWMTLSFKIPVLTMHILLRHLCVNVKNTVGLGTKTHIPKTKEIWGV